MAVLDEQEDRALAAQAVAAIACGASNRNSWCRSRGTATSNRSGAREWRAAPHRISRRDERRHPVSDRARPPARTHTDGTPAATRAARAAPDNMTDEALSQGLHDG